MNECCPECRAPLGEDAQYIDGKRYCAVCSSLFYTVNSRTFFQAEQRKYEEEKKNVDRLRLGGNYFA